MWHLPQFLPSQLFKQKFLIPTNANTFGKAISPIPLYEGGSCYVEAK